MHKIIRSVAELLLISGVMIYSSCKKPTAVPISLAKTTNATITYSGPAEADGCRWLIRLNSDNTIYSPVNLSADFQKDSLKVNVSYTILTTKTYCGDLPGTTGITQIKIESIKQNRPGFLVQVPLPLCWMDILVFIKQ